jgi:hypothetical protein
VTVLPQVRDQLDSAAHRLADPAVRPSGAAARRPSGVRSWRMKAALSRVGLVTSAVVVAVVVAIVVLLGHSSGGSRPAPAAGTPRDPAAALERILGVLRRPQTTGDRDPRALQYLQVRSPLSKARGVPDLALLRKATVTPWGATVFVDPITPLTDPQIAKLPASIREIARIRAASAQQNGDGLSVFEIYKPGDIDGSSGASARQILANQTVQFTLGQTITRVITVVPDGVTKVVLQRPRQNQPGDPIYPHVLTIAAAVHDNIAAFTVPSDRVGVGGSPTQYVQWLGPNGLIRRFGSPSRLHKVAPHS